MNSANFKFISKIIEKPGLSKITEKLNDCFGAEEYISHFFKQENLRDINGNAISIDELLKSEYIESVTHQPTNSEIPKYRKLEGFEIQGCLANIMFRGSCHHEFFSNQTEAINVASSCISSIYQERAPYLSAYLFESSWSSWFIGEDIMDITLLVFCPGRQFWWLLCLTDTD
ncbi:hypothetical protein [Pseudoalteromonas aurantia]|uniref:Uncharacterized protein n=1 Tax=Pseudoalteromonas aurantia TaxID=43654 RepID=A0A5S3VAG4_9GAMM|nr:hypothetical protein [Pseudoalteromonas aurantia]TMO68938.1 hypothetical protein CWC19_06970 [Pseudoalteromonas aurantia]TMO76480.1 hypothetical protein CWC20_05705 [Pseudoalteromonas aurantia]